MFNPSQLEALKAPLNRSSVKTRQQAGRAMSYVEGWHAIAEANRIFGFDGWDRTTVDMLRTCEPREVDGKWRVAYYAKVRITVRADGHTITRDGCGYGSGIDKDLGSAHESALKEAETDAMKRALMTFGNPFGLALYDKEQSEVVDDTKPPPKLPTAPAAKTMTPAQWAIEAREKIRNFTTTVSLKEWNEKNDAAIHKLERANPDEFHAVQAELSHAYGRLSTLRAG